MNKVACGVGCYGDRTWELYKTKSGRYQLRVHTIETGQISKEWVYRADVPEYARHASWLQSKSLLEDC